MVKKHGDSDRENLLGPLHGLLFAISSQGHSVLHPPDRIAHTMAFVTPVVDFLAGKHGRKYYTL